MNEQLIHSSDCFLSGETIWGQACKAIRKTGHDIGESGRFLGKEIVQFIKSLGLGLNGKITCPPNGTTDNILVSCLIWQLSFKFLDSYSLSCKLQVSDQHTSHPALLFFSHLICEIGQRCLSHSCLGAHFKVSGEEGISGPADDCAASLSSNLMMWLWYLASQLN